MDEYRKEAARKYFERKQQAEDKATDDVTPPPKRHLADDPPGLPDHPSLNRQDAWIQVQTETLRDCGFSDTHIALLLTETCPDDCVNWTTPASYTGAALPFAWRVKLATSDQIMGFNLIHVVLLASVSGHTAVQTRQRLDITAEQWQEAVRRWALVNPFPLEPFSQWTLYELQCNHTQTIAEAVLAQKADQGPDWRGVGVIQVPRELVAEAERRPLSQRHPFVVVQVAFRRNDVLEADFVVLQFDQPVVGTGRLGLSPALQARMGAYDQQYVHARLVELQPVRPAAHGVGVRLRCCSSPHSGKAAPTAEQLQTELERHYIVVRGQWIVLQDELAEPWVYRVHTIWSIHGRPCHAANLYGAHVAVDIQADPTAAEHTLEHIFNTWNHVSH